MIRLSDASVANPHRYGNCGAQKGTPLSLTLPPDVGTTAIGKRGGKGVGLASEATRGALNARQMHKVISLDAACASSGEIKVNEM